MEDKIKFPANVILIDVAFLNEVVYGAKNFLEGKLGRKLPDVDLPAWLSYLALDAGLREQENEVEVLLVHTPAADVLKCCEPSDVNKLNHQACRTPLGEFTFSSVTSSGLVSTEELFLDLMNLALDSADVKCLMLCPFNKIIYKWLYFINSERSFYRSIFGWYSVGFALYSCGLTPFCTPT
jgi:hypothetical protein